MKPIIKGELEQLYNSKITKTRKTSTFSGVEWVSRHDTRKYFDGTNNPNGKVWYTINICGFNTHGVAIAAYFNPETEKAYFWQCANADAVNDIMRNPENAYNWRCVKNGIKY